MAEINSDMYHSNNSYSSYFAILTQMNNKKFIIIAFPLAMLLSSCATYKAEIYPCDFNKYKFFRTEYSENVGHISSSVNDGMRFFRFTYNARAQKNTLLLTIGTTDGIIFPPHLGRHWLFSWNYPPKTVTIIATDSVNGEMLFAIYYSRYMISMDSDGFYDRIQSSVEYCIEELKKSPPKDGPRKVTIPASGLSKVHDRLYNVNED